MSKVSIVCPNCGKDFDLGYNGVMNYGRGRNECDECAGIKRDAVYGYAWDNDELTRGYIEFENGNKLVVDVWPNVSMVEVQH